MGSQLVARLADALCHTVDSIRGTRLYLQHAILAEYIVPSMEGIDKVALQVVWTVCQLKLEALSL